MRVITLTGKHASQSSSVRKFHHSLPTFSVADINNPLSISDYLLHHVRLSVLLHGTTQFPSDGFSLNFIFEDFYSKICQENWSCRLMYVHLWKYLAELFWKWGMFQTKFVEKIKMHILCTITFFPSNLATFEITWKITIVMAVKYGTKKMQIARRITKARIQKHTQNM